MIILVLAFITAGLTAAVLVLEWRLFIGLPVSGIAGVACFAVIGFARQRAAVMAALVYFCIGAPLALTVRDACRWGVVPAFLCALSAPIIWGCLLFFSASARAALVNATPQGYFMAFCVLALTVLPFTVEPLDEGGMCGGSEFLSPNQEMVLIVAGCDSDTLPTPEYDLKVAHALEVDGLMWVRPWECSYASRFLQDTADATGLKAAVSKGLLGCRFIDAFLLLDDARNNLGMADTEAYRLRRDELVANVCAHHMDMAAVVALSSIIRDPESGVELTGRLRVLIGRRVRMELGVAREKPAPMVAAAALHARGIVFADIVFLMQASIPTKILMFLLLLHRAMLTQSEALLKQL